MHALFDVRSASGSHSVFRSDGSVVDAVRAAGAQIVIADARFADDLAGVDLPLIAVEAEEEEKTLARATDIIGECRRAGLTRDGRIAAVGGGIVQDLSCFVASVYMRGVGWTYVPTTLLSMVDSCIGGKSSINVGEYKNIAGTFHPPAAIVVAPAFADTLPPEHVAAGWCEAAKITFAKGDDAFAEYLQLFDGGDRGAIIEHSLRCKKWFVEIDEFDRAERQLLNFGHSFGHALESATSYAVIHGVAVGVGVLSALDASEALTPGVAALPAVQQLRAHLLQLLSPLKDLPAALSAMQRQAFFRAFASDKKHSASAYRLILVGPDGRLRRQEVARDTTSEDLIWNGFEAARDRIATADR